MYKVILTIVKYDRQLLGEAIKGKDEKTIDNILSDYDIRPESVVSYSEYKTTDNLATATHIYNNYLDDMNFIKDPFTELTKNMYVHFLKLYELRFDSEALEYFDILASCNELTGGTRFEGPERIGRQ